MQINKGYWFVLHASPALRRGSSFSRLLTFYLNHNDLIRVNSEFKTDGAVHQSQKAHFNSTLLVSFMAPTSLYPVIRSPQLDGPTHFFYFVLGPDDVSSSAQAALTRSAC
jgi:hypothetical protein